MLVPVLTDCHADLVAQMDVVRVVSDGNSIIAVAVPRGYVSHRSE